MMMRIMHELRHILRAQNDSNSTRITAIYDPEHANTTFSGSGGKLSVDDEDLEGLAALVTMVIDLRDNGGRTAEVGIE